MDRLLALAARIEPRERSTVFTAFLLFFCVLCGYFMLRPVRETIGTVLGEAEVTNLFLATWLASIALIPLYGLACSLLPRTVVLAGVYGLFGTSLLVLAALMHADPGNVAAARFFFVWISVFNLFVVSVFWTLMVDRSSTEQAKRLFGFIAAGGTLGAWVAPQVTKLLIDPVGRTGILLVSAGLFALAILCQLVLVRMWRNRARLEMGGAPVVERAIGGNPFAGITGVLRSPYLLLFCAFMLLLSSATTFLYFDQLRLVAEAYPDENDRTRVFANLDLTVQTLTLVTQLFVTSRIASSLGVIVLLVSVPVAMIGGFLTLAIAGNFWVLAAAMVMRRAGEYALTRPGREILFTSVDVETKYKAKNLIDVVVYRGGDALSSQVRNALRASGLSSGWIAGVGAGIALLWAIVGYTLGRMHERRAALSEPATDARSHPATSRTS